MRTTKELLILLRDYIIEEDEFTGMCSSNIKLCLDGFITNKESVIINDFLLNNTPLNCSRYSFWFPKGEKQPRINYLNEKIKTL